LADNYLEMCKQRLYGNSDKPRAAAITVLYQCLLSTIKLLAPFLPFVTEAIYQELFAQNETNIDSRESESRSIDSIHNSPWPIAEITPSDDHAEKTGAVLIDIATAVRRYKSERNLPLGTELDKIKLAAVIKTPSEDQVSGLMTGLASAIADLQSVTRARIIEITEQLSQDTETILIGDQILLQIVP
jgi:valyl-tRNA synthetase